MTVSSRTPEGAPLECPLCGRTARLELCEPLRDATCPACGQLLTWLAHRQNGNEKSPHSVDDVLENLKADSLDLVELIMEMEDDFGITFPDSVYEQIRSPRDAVRALSKLIDEGRLP